MTIKLADSVEEAVVEEALSTFIVTCRREVDQLLRLRKGEEAVSLFSKVEVAETILNRREVAV